MYETVGQLRIQEMFDIVVDYPDSRPAVQDVKDCLAHTNLHRKFVAGFKQAIGERLLHAGQAWLLSCCFAMAPMPSLASSSALSASLSNLLVARLPSGIAASSNVPFLA